MARSARKLAVPDVAESLGLTYRKKADREFVKSYSDLPGIRSSGSVMHLLTGELDERLVTIFQHTYMIYTPQAPVPIIHSVYAVEGPQWPMLRVAPRPFWARLARRLGWRAGMELDLPQFNAAFKVTTDDEDFALTLLCPEMQHFMMDKRNVRWYVGRGRVCLIYSGSLKPPRITESLDRLRRFWSLVPPELEAW
ncbi:MAG: hypothetical protein O7D97_04635 [Planctomycetota bacterium]|nr:hypothetical protein [Planctomycetota bacterium]